MLSGLFVPSSMVRPPHSSHGSLRTATSFYARGAVGTLPTNLLCVVKYLGISHYFLPAP